jgi:hypothetical protein
MFTTKNLRVLVTLLMLVSLGTVALAQRNNRRDNQRGGRLEYLGEANVDGRVDHDRITVGRNDGQFSRIQIRVERAPIEFQRVIVHFANGGDEEIELRNRIPAGGQTRMIDLRGRDRAISSVEFWYSRANSRFRSRQPKVRLYGSR